MVLTITGSADSSFDHFNDVGSSELYSGIEPADDITHGLNSNSASNDITMPSFEPDEVLLEQQTNLNNSSEIPMFDPERDMSKWNVTIPRVEPQRDPIDGHTMYAYVISIERFDVNDDNDQTSLSATETLQKWSVIRHYNEFYILESKLIEFHGNMIKTASLPPRRLFNCKSRVYM
ncbi:unnamed protein product, partial [Onchocerca flexuosa]|uniref:PX domain-containing protein n=1 Tax=Onchocerca flexuosa TaxID=387005 RepID=A0A183HSM9_9BILA